MTDTARTLKGVFEKSLRKYTDRTAVRFADEILMYGEVDRRANAVAHAFADRGIGPNDRVAVLLTNTVEYLLTDLGVIKAGATKIPLNDSLTASEIEYMLNDSRAETLVCGPEFIEMVEGLRDSLDHVERFVGVGDGAELPSGFEPFADLDGERAGSPDVDPAPSDLAGHFYTGGTTGKPKGVVHTQESMTMNAYSHIAELGFDGEETLLLMTPLPHSAGGFRWGVLLTGATVLVQDGFGPQKALELIDEQSVTWTFMVPTMIYRVLDAPELADYDTSSIETLVYGAAPMTPARLREGLDEFGPVFLQFYGQTEVPNLITTFGKREHKISVQRDQTERLSSAGQPCLMADVKIVDVESSEPQPPGEEGEILATAPYVMQEYFERPEAMTETMTDDGWVHTGDIGKLDEDGYVYLLDRASDIIITGGMNVYSTEVEEALDEHPDVSHVAVIGVPHEDWGEAVKAIVVSEGEASAKLESDILAFAAEDLADYKQPKDVDFVESIPETPYGKMDKKALRDRYWEDRERQIN